jgi:FixJ family two-component response regulator
VAPVPLICIIDDDDSLRSALVGLVRSLGYRSKNFGSAEQFLSHGEPQQYDCIITDIQLPGINGIELKRCLNNKGCLQPFIMISARGEASLEQQAIASGAVCFLRKPFETDTLISCIEAALKGPRTDRS